MATDKRDSGFHPLKNIELLKKADAGRRLALWR
jgi:hypothetical protein